MKAVIMGCGRVGAAVAALLEQDGFDVTVVDLEPYAFRRLPDGFKGDALIGNGMDYETLKRAGIEDAQVFIAATQGDNRNVLASQVAKEIFRVPKVVCRIYDPIRHEMYLKLGLESFCPTTSGAEKMFALVKKAN